MNPPLGEFYGILQKYIWSQSDVQNPFIINGGGGENWLASKALLIPTGLCKKFLVSFPFVAV